MVRCMFNGKVYETCLPQETEFDDETTRATKIMEDDFDETGRARAKIVYVDVGDLTNYLSEDCGDVRKDARMHIQIIISREEEKERMEGRPRPMLIFLLQDRDYWPGSDNDPDVMARRAVKQKAYEELKFYLPRPDYVEIYVPPEPGYLNPSIDIEESRRKAFRRYFDPSLPGSKFILDNMGDNYAELLDHCLLNPDLLRKWNEWIATTKVEEAPAVLLLYTKRAMARNMSIYN